MTSGHRFIAFAALLALGSLLAPTVAEAAPKKHVVVAGDSLWKIAHRSGVAVSAICKENGIKEGDVLKAGQVLVIPDSADKTKRAPAPAAKGSHKTAGETGKAAPKAKAPADGSKPKRGTAKSGTKKAG
jgi:LysM repeat protein